MRAGSSPPQRPEYGIATLFTAATDPAPVDPGASAQPLSRPTAAPAGGTVRRLRIGDLVGRRPQLRDALAALRGKPAAERRWGRVAEVTLTGIGGIGKTAVAGRVLTRLQEEGGVEPGRGPARVLQGGHEAEPGDALRAAGHLGGCRDLA